MTTKREQDIGQLFEAVTHAEKYQSGNPLANWMVRNFMGCLLATVREAGSPDVHEVGCGEGHILGMLVQNGFQVRGCDVNDRSLAVARREAERMGLDIPLSNKSVYDLDPATDAASTVMCCEVMEHLEHPKEALTSLLRVARRDLILSVPAEPMWRAMNMARGKYWRDWGNTPGHVQHWSKRRFVELISSQADVVSVKSPVPWTVVHCRPRAQAKQCQIQ